MLDHRCVLYSFRNNLPEVFFVRKCYKKFTEKHLHWSLITNKVTGLMKKKLWYRYFPMNFAKFLRAPILRNTSGQLLLGTAQKIKFSIKNFISNCDQIRRKLPIWSHLLKKSLMEYFHFLCSVGKFSWFRLTTPVFTFCDGGPYHTETSPLVCSVNQLTHFYMIRTFVMKVLL